MRRWAPFCLVPLLAVVLLATVLIAPTGARAATSLTTTNFKGRAVTKDTDTHYVVLSFTCSGGKLSTGWTYEVSGTQSFTGVLGTPTPSCALVSTDNGATWSTSPDGTTAGPLANIPLAFNGAPVQGTLTLSFTDVGASKTFFGTFVSNTTGDCVSSAPPCIAVSTDNPLVIPTTPTPTTVPGFSLVAGSYSTLNLSVR